MNTEEDFWGLFIHEEFLHSPVDEQQGDLLQPTHTDPPNVERPDSRYTSRNNRLEGINAKKSTSSGAESGTRTKRKRATYSPKRRAKVARIRMEGACFKCRIIMKSECETQHVPCKTCEKSQKAKKGRKPKYGWMHCVSFHIGKIDMFALGLSCTAETCANILRLSDDNMSRDLRVAVDEDFVNWDSRAISQDISKDFAGSTCLIGSAGFASSCASSKFQQLISLDLDAVLCKKIRLFVETSFALAGNAFNSSSDSDDLAPPNEQHKKRYMGHTTEDIRVLHSFAGDQVLKGLDTLTGKMYTRKLASEQYHTLLVALFGVLVAVVHSPVKARQMRHELLNILCHHLLYTAQELGLVNPKTAEDTIEDLQSLIDREPSFRWRAGFDYAMLGQSPSCSSGDRDVSQASREAIMVNMTQRLSIHESCQICDKTEINSNLVMGVCLDCIWEMKTGITTHQSSSWSSAAGESLKCYCSETDYLDDEEPNDDDDEFLSKVQAHLNSENETFDSSTAPRMYGRNQLTCLGMWIYESKENVAEGDLAIHDMCVWCDNEAGADGVCETCKTGSCTRVIDLLAGLI